MTLKIPLNKLTTAELHDKRVKLTAYLKAVTEEIELRESRMIESVKKPAVVSKAEPVKKEKVKKETTDDREAKWKVADMKKVLNEKGVKTTTAMRKPELVKMIYEHRCVGKMG